MSPRPFVLCAATFGVIVAGCGPDQVFSISDAEGVELATGAYEVGGTGYFEAVEGGTASIDVVLDDESQPCRVMTIAFCPRDAGETLTVRPIVSSEKLRGPTCDGAAYVAQSVHATFRDTCAGLDVWELASAEATVELDGDEAHVKLQGSFDPSGSTVGTFAVDVDVHADLTPEKDRFDLDAVE